MPLINLKTDLKSLKYGMDRPGGGSSGQPFIQKPIPDIDAASTAETGFSIGNDFGIRGGFLRPGIAVDDLERIYKLYTETSTGLAFNAKQVALGLLANPTQVWNPLTVPAQVIADGLGFGHVPAFINPDILNFFSQPFPNARTRYGFKGESREEFFKMGNPAKGTNNSLKGSLGATSDRKNPDFGVREKKGIAPTQNILLPGTADEVSLTRLYTASTPEDVVDNDMIKFVISVVDNNDPSKRTWLHFRAYIDSFSDGFNSNWNEVKYVGRGESFYNYGGFSRDISLGFRIAVQSKQEQSFLYEKLNYLISTTAPDYSEAGFMRGNLTYLTVGDYLIDLPGVIKNISLGGFEESPWELGRTQTGTVDSTIAQLPHSLTVSLGFSPIHNFIPRKGAKFIGYKEPTLNNG